MFESEESFRSVHGKKALQSDYPLNGIYQVCNINRYIRFDFLNGAGTNTVPRVFDMLHQGLISTIKPINVFPFSQLESAIRLIQDGKTHG